MIKVSFETLIEKCQRIANEHGWYVSWNRTMSTCSPLEAIALIHTELSEAVEAYRDDDRKAFETEIADTFIRLFHLLGDLGMTDIEKVIEEKMRKNEKRPFRHGRKNI
jgi:NTP pyrophosphatase (non-canonical NTP hydrolase)